MVKIGIRSLMKTVFTYLEVSSRKQTSFLGNELKTCSEGFGFHKTWDSNNPPDHIKNTQDAHSLVPSYVVHQRKIADLSMIISINSFIEKR